ncbi:DNA/RNA nuclease SfsA [Candidatus Hakubella thermalkaliphila]|uniref:DNA/RNA nuclease SfsA n=1 Tax=Candidatus Hakubella thermalkaliphila TaxID=2754717 RepID=UPI00159300E2|nr:DNA/RNA nuclease SfsA [Candidatus Hakubella thermalkaliphila]
MRGSRTDLRGTGGEIPPVYPAVLEVKSCTLFNQEMAMFPDAITLRGKRHLIELAELSHKGLRGGVLFQHARGRSKPSLHSSFKLMLGKPVPSLLQGLPLKKRLY